MILQGEDLQYQLLYPLGDGTFGITFLAQGEDSNMYAIKKFKNYDDLRQEGVPHKKAVERAAIASSERDYEETTLRAALSICQNHAGCFIESISQDGNSYIVMDFIEGKSVFAAIFGSNRIPMVQRRSNGQQFIKDLVSGLAAIHRVGLVHQDIKAENLMLTKTGNVKFIDFGLACFLNKGVDFEFGVPIFGSHLNWPCGSYGTWTTTPPEMFHYTSRGLVREIIDKDGKRTPYTDGGIYTSDYLLAHDIWSIACVIMNWYLFPDNSRDIDSTAYSISFLSNNFSTIFNELRSVDEIAYKVVCALMNRDHIQRIDNFNQVVSYYTDLRSLLADLPDFPNTWNRFGVTQRERKALAQFRCAAVKYASPDFDRLDVKNQESAIGVTTRICNVLEQEDSRKSERKRSKTATQRSKQTRVDIPRRRVPPVTRSRAARGMTKRVNINRGAVEPPSVDFPYELVLRKPTETDFFENPISFTRHF